MLDTFFGRYANNPGFGVQKACGNKVDSEQSLAARLLAPFIQTV